MKCMLPALFPEECVHKITVDSTPVLVKLWRKSYLLLGSPGQNSLRNKCSYGCTPSSALLSSLNNGKRLVVVALTYVSVIESESFLTRVSKACLSFDFLFCLSR